MLTYSQVPFKALETDETFSAVGYSQYNWSLARWLVYSLLAGTGDGIIAGFHASVSAGNVLIQASPDVAHVAIITDATGPVIVRTTAEVTRLAAAMIPDGAHYVYAALDETSRTAQTWVVGSQLSPTPPVGAVNICKATVVGGVVTAVDSTVKADPQILKRLYWGSSNFHYSADDSTSLISAIGDIRNSITNAWPYAAASSVEERIAALESLSGSASASTVYWDSLQAALGDTQKIKAYVLDQVAAHVAAYHTGVAGGVGSSGGIVPIQVNWNEDATNNLKQSLRWLHTDVYFTEDHVRAAFSIPGIIGLGENGSGLVEDAALTTFRRDTTNRRYY